MGRALAGEREGGRGKGGERGGILSIFRLLRNHAHGVDLSKVMGGGRGSAVNGLFL